MIFMSFGKTSVNFFQTKKNAINGGHFHSYSVTRTILRGKIKYVTKNLTTDEEKISIISAPHFWIVQENVVELIITLEDSIYTETYKEPIKLKFIFLLEKL